VRPFSTVRARTALGASLALGIALLLSASSAGALLRRSLIRNIDEVAEVRAADVATLAGSGRLPQSIASQEGEIVQVVSGAGRVLASSRRGGSARPVSSLRPPPGRSRAQTVDQLEGGVGVADEYRVLALRGTGGPDPPVVYVATGLDAVEHKVAVLSRLVFFGLPALLGLVALSAWLAVGRALRPVEAIRAEVADISARDLDRRVPQSGGGDEVDRLAQTMNAMLDRLQRSAERQRRFVADASHELRSPLASTRAQLEVALSHPDSSVWEATALDLLSENQRMERLVNDLLFLARNEERPPGASRLIGATALDLDDIVLAEAGRLRTRGRVQVDISRVSAGRVRGVGDHLTRVVRNLVENAERHAAGTVRLELGSVLTNGRGPQVQLVVTDDGPGVPLEHREHIFDRFIRLDDHRSRPNGDGSGGSGLGLAICREIVTAHGGRIWADEARGGGARFVVQIPAG
jgi:signal transduction histidine kinase